MQPFYSERLYYRPFRRSDAEAAFDFFGDPEVMEYSAFGVHPNIERTAEMLAGFIDHNRRRGFGLWAVIERDTDELIGMAGLTEFDKAGDLELAYRLRRDRWGRGYGTEAATAWVEKGFSTLGLPQIVYSREGRDALRRAAHPARQTGQLHGRRPAGRRSDRRLLGLMLSLSKYEARCPRPSISSV
jgi:hypothetical protein